MNRIMVGGRMLGLAVGLLLGRTAEGAPAATGPTRMDVNYRALVSRADVTRPFPLGVAEAEYPGLPIGNGRLGTLLWQPSPATLAMQLNHTDVFVFRGSSVASRGDHQDYGNVCGRVEIGFGEDVFRMDTTRNHLGLYDALATVSGAGVRVRGLAWHAKDVLALEIADERAEPKPITVDLAMTRPAVQESGSHKAISEVMVEGADIELTQQFLEPKANPLVKDLASFTAVRARAIGRAAAAEARGDRVRLTVPAGKGSFVVLFAVGQSLEEPLAKVRAGAKASLETAAALGFDKLLADNGVYWSDFWARSFVSMTGTPELEEMTAFYLWTQYLAGICLRGTFPPKHSGLIFITQEYRPWGSLFWWYNESAQQGWQFEANRLELLMPVFRWNQVARPGYESAARQSWNSRGWYIPETSSWDGPELLPEGQYKPEGHRTGVHQSLRGNGFTARNTYNGAKFAALYYKYYQFTGDETWLKEKAYPALRDTAEFYCGLKAGFRYAGGIDYGEEGKAILKKDADGKYHLYGTILHEHIWWGKDIIEDLAAIRGIFPVAIAVSKRLGVDADKRAEWQEVLDNLAPYVMSDQPGAIGSLGPGTWAQGLPPNGNIRDNMGEESPRLGPIGGDFLDSLTLESNNPDEWKTAMTTLEKHAGAHAGRYIACGTYPVAVARMGRADMIERVLPLQMRSSAQQSRLGASHSLQGPGVYARALHAALLLSVAPSPAEDAILHVLPSWPRKWDVAFQLQAKGGFLVSASLKNEQLGLVEILSQRGGECRLRNPWPGTEIEILREGRRMAKTKDDLVVIKTNKGGVYVLVPAGSGAPAGKLRIPAPTMLEVAVGSDRPAALKALSVIEGHGGLEAAPAIAKLLAETHDAELRAAAARTLSAISGRVDAVALQQTLLPLLSGAKGPGKAALLHALPKMNTPEAVEALTAAADDADREVARLAKEALDDLRSLSATDGFIVSWQVAGPYTDGNVFETAYAPEQGDAGVEWRLHAVAGKSPFILPLAQILGGEGRAAYLKAVVHADQAQAVRFETGSDDGIKVWLNGELLYGKNAARGCAPGDDVFTGQLKAGENTILCKVINQTGGWSACVRLRAADGGALRGVSVK